MEARTDKNSFDVFSIGADGVVYCPTMFVDL